MERIYLFLAGCCAFFLLIGTAYAGMDMPEGLKKDFPQYPDSQLIQVMSMGNAEVVMVNCGSSSLDAVYGYYLTKAKDSGWTVQLESKQQDVMLLGAEKDSRKLMINVAVEDGNTVVALSLATE